MDERALGGEPSASTRPIPLAAPVTSAAFPSAGRSFRHRSTQRRKTLRAYSREHTARDARFGRVRVGEPPGSSSSVSAASSRRASASI